MQFISILLVLWFCVIPLASSESGLSVSASQAQVARLYRSPEERREAGIGRQITDWLSVSGLIELETAYSRNHFTDNRDRTESERPALALQLGMEITVSDWLEAELIYDVETNGKRKLSGLDEAMVGVDLEPWGFKAGRQYLPFGEYYSYFVSGPMQDFGEARADSLIIDYAVSDQFEITGYILDGDSKQSGSDGFYSDWDWGANIELVSVNEAIRINVGYLSDLAESDGSLLADSGNSYSQRVPAWNGNILLGFDHIEMTAEVVQASRAFTEFEKGVDRPFAWNLELAYFPKYSVQYALRLGFSDELVGQPRWQYGVALTWRPFKNTSLSLEYLRNEYKKEFVLDDNDNELNSRDQVAAQLSIEF